MGHDPDAHVKGVDLRLDLLQCTFDLNQRRCVVEAGILGLEGLFQVVQSLGDLRQLARQSSHGVVRGHALLVQLLQLVLYLRKAIKGIEMDTVRALAHLYVLQTQ